MQFFKSLAMLDVLNLKTKCGVLAIKTLKCLLNNYSTLHLCTCKYNIKSFVNPSLSLISIIFFHVVLQLISTRFLATSGDSTY